MSSMFVALGDVDYPGSSLDFILKMHGIGRGDLIRELANKNKLELLDLAHHWIEKNPIYFDKNRNIKTGPLDPIILSSSVAKIPIALFKDKELYRKNDKPIAFFILNIEDYKLCGVRYGRYQRQVDELRNKIKHNQSLNPKDIFCTNELIKLLIRNYLSEYLEGIKIDDNTYIIENRKNNINNFILSIKKLKKLCLEDGMEKPTIDLKICKLKDLNHEERKIPAAGYILWKMDGVRDILHQTRIEEINKFYINKMNMMLSEIHELICEYRPDGLGVTAKYQELLIDYRNIINWSNEP